MQCPTASKLISLKLQCDNVLLYYCFICCITAHLHNLFDLHNANILSSIHDAQIYKKCDVSIYQIPYHNFRNAHTWNNLRISMITQCASFYLFIFAFAYSQFVHVRSVMSISLSILMESHANDYYQNDSTMCCCITAVSLLICIMHMTCIIAMQFFSSIRDAQNLVAKFFWLHNVPYLHNLY